MALFCKSASRQKFKQVVIDFLLNQPLLIRIDDSHPHFDVVSARQRKEFHKRAHTNVLVLVDGWAFVLGVHSKSFQHVIEHLLMYILDIVSELQEYI